MAATAVDEKPKSPTADVDEDALVLAQKGTPLPWMPSDMTQGYRIAKQYAAASIIPDVLRGKPNDVLVIIAWGRLFGLEPVAALRSIYVVKGKPYAEAKLKVGLVRRSKECMFWLVEEYSATRSRVTTQRVGDPKPTTFAFTDEDCKTAGLVGGTHGTYPKAMKLHRCESALADAVYPDLTLGLGVLEEMEDADRPDLPWAQRVAAVPATVAPMPPLEKAINPAPAAKPGRIIDVPSDPKPANGEPSPLEKAIAKLADFGNAPIPVRSWEPIREALKAEGGSEADIETAKAAWHKHNNDVRVK